MDQLNVAILDRAKKKGGNAVVGVFSSIAFDDGGFQRRYFMTGTYAIVQRIA